MIDGERRGVIAAGEHLAPIIREAHETGIAPSMPSDEELGRDAAAVWQAMKVHGDAHIEPREAFLRGYGSAVRYLLNQFQQQQGSEAEYVVLTGTHERD